MKVAFLGAAQAVTGSQHLLNINGHKILLDCGLYQGRPQEAYEHNSNFGFDPGELQAVILSHAHIDHSGNLPSLVKKGFQGPIYATHVTAALSEVMLADAGHIQESEAEELNRRQTGKGKRRVEPLYTQEEAEKVAQYFEKAPFNKPFEPAPGVTVRLVEAGHILGSAAVVVDAEEDGQIRRLWYSGDIGRRNLPLVRDPVLPSDADALIMECTYGDRDHGDPLQVAEDLLKVVTRTIERGGKVIVPAFAVGRTQDLVYHLNQMIDRGDLPEVPVYVDSPLAVQVSEIFRSYPEYFDWETQNFILADKNRSALEFEHLTYIDAVNESRELVEQNGPMVIISASGMAETGRILHHLRNNIEDRRNTVLIVSYQAPGTLGRELVDGAREVEILGEVYPVRAEIARLEGLSAHADQEFLLEYALAVKGQVKQIFLVHGEQQAAEKLREKMQAAGLEKIYYPYLRQMMEV